MGIWVHWTCLFPTKSGLQPNSPPVEKDQEITLHISRNQTNHAATRLIRQITQNHKQIEGDLGKTLAFRPHHVANRSNLQHEWKKGLEPEQGSRSAAAHDTERERSRWQQEQGRARRRTEKMKTEEKGEREEEIVRLPGENARSWCEWEVRGGGVFIVEVKEKRGNGR
jgi:hypothetical protein